MVELITKVLVNDTKEQSSDPVLWNDWHVLASAQSLAPGALIKARLLEQDLVLWRSQDGQVCAWDDRCPHRSVRLSHGKVVENTLVCSYHGLAYATEGRCVRVPAHPDYHPPKQACVRTYAVQECYGLIYVCLGEPANAIPAFPEWADPTYRGYITGPYHIRSNPLRAIENFLDVAHFPFIHGGSLGDIDKPEIAPYEVSLDQNGVYARDIQVWQPDPYGTGEGAYVSYDYWALRPLTAYLRKVSPTGDCLTLFYTVTPISEVECVSWMSGAMNYAQDISLEEIKAFQDKIVLEDLANLESHNPPQLPLDSSMEFHIPSDRSTLTYRKWLKQLGVTYGTTASNSSQEPIC